MNVELLRIRKRGWHFDNVEVTMRIANCVRKVDIFRVLDGDQDFKMKLLDEKWVQTCLEYAVRKLITGDEFERTTPENGFILGRMFSLGQLIGESS